MAIRPRVIAFESHGVHGAPTSMVKELLEREAWTGFVDVSSLRLPLPPGAQVLAWRVSAVARGSATYAASGWSVFAVPPS
jgi:hypothetical protein